MTKRLIFFAIAVISLTIATAQERIIFLNEGNWNSDDGQVSLIEGSTITNKWFQQQNPKKKIGDTPNDIIHLRDNLIAICVNTSNIIQYITADGKECGATENVPNNRKMASDGNYLYVTSYAHTTALGEKYTKGYVAKINIDTKEVVKTCEVGYEPEGIALYNGKLFVANSGGYAVTENHGHETTVSVVDAETMQKITDIDTECINLFGSMAQYGKYLCINSAGNYESIGPKTIILNCDDYSFVTYDFASTISCSHNGKFYCIGTNFSQITYSYDICPRTIDPESGIVSDGIGIGSIDSDIKKMKNPYDLYFNPYTGFIYVSDANEFQSAGYVYQYNESGVLQNKFKAYLQPAHFLALPPSGTGIRNTMSDALDDAFYNLQGVKTTNPAKGQIYIYKGKKIVF